MAERDRREAERLARDIFRTVDEERSDRFLMHDEIPTADVEADVERFQMQIRFSKRHGIPVPCLRLAENSAPIDWLVGFMTPWGPPFFLEEEWYTWANRENYFLSQPAEATEMFRTAAVDFLETRLAARRSSIRNQPGIQFTVHSQSARCRVHYSPCYYVKTQTVFGAPTTPVTGWIQPGRYIFGVVPPGQLLPTFDPAHFSVPPLTVAHLAV